MNILVQNKGVLKMNLYSQFDGAISRLSDNIYKILVNIDNSIKSNAYEVRIRLGQPIQIIGEYGSYFVRSDSSITSDYKNCRYSISKYDISESLNKICDYSIHTHLEEMQKGFVTIHGGHRVGICGTAVIKENKIYNIRDVSSLNIRIAHEVLDSSKLIPQDVIFSNTSFIIAGPPLSGKTTILRDISRRLSQKGKKVVIIDERFEIACTYEGKTSNDLGPSCDILSGFPKEQGIINAFRTLSPDIIVCDEIGDLSETSAIIQGFNSGVRFIVSIHANTLTSLKNKPQFLKLYNSGQFDFAVILSNINNMRQIEVVNLKEKI